MTLTFQAQAVATSPTSSSAATLAAPTRTSQRAPHAPTTTLVASYVGYQSLRHADRLMQSYRGMFGEVARSCLD